jgi:hypothetical protein
LSEATLAPGDTDTRLDDVFGPPLTRSATIGVALVSRSGYLVVASPRFVSMTGCGMDGEDVTAALAAPHRPRFTSFLASVHPGWEDEVFGFLVPGTIDYVDCRLWVQRSNQTVALVVEPVSEVLLSVDAELRSLTNELAEANRVAWEQNRTLEQRTRSLVNALKELRHARSVVRQLESILPTCSYCSRMHDPVGEDWVDLEEYLRRHRVALSHGICPNCLEPLMLGHA